MLEDRPAVDDQVDASERHEPRPRRSLRCAACGHLVTNEDRREEMGGEHRHTFVNPHGHVFEIGVFSTAPGARGVGEPSSFFSWFPGYVWRIVVCGGCGAHLGWSFGEGPHFFGLIVDRLVEADDREEP